MPHPDYYKKLCRTHFGLAVVTGSFASDKALERTAWTMDSMMMRIDPQVARLMIGKGFRQAVLGSYPSENDTSLPEFSHLVQNRMTRGLGATVYNPIGSNAEEDILCSPSDLYPDEDITVHEVPHTLCVSSDYISISRC